MKLPPEHFQVEVTPQQSTRFGEKLMKQMGWEKGQGLGKEGTGRKEHIRVKKKDNTEGVGKHVGRRPYFCISCLLLTIAEQFLGGRSALGRTGIGA